MAFRILEPQSSRIWVPHGMFRDWFGQHTGRSQRLNRCWWQSIQWVPGAIMGTCTSRTECVNQGSPDSLYCLTKNFITQNSMEEYWAVVCKWWLINRRIASRINYLARCMNYNRMKSTSIRILLGSALPKGQVLIMWIANQSGQIMMTLIIDGSRFWIDNTLK